MNLVSLYLVMMAFVAVSDWLLPGSFKLLAFPLFGTGEEYEEKFKTFYNHWFFFRITVNAIAFAVAIFLQLGDAFVIAAIALFLLQVMFFMWRAEIYARPVSGRKWWKNEN